MFLILVMWICFHGFASGIIVTVNPSKPALGNSMTVTCQRSSSSTSSISWDVNSTFLTNCDGSTNDVCIPSPTGYTFSTDVSMNEFNLTLALITITDCKTYVCTDAVTNSDTTSMNIQLADFSKNDISSTEPGASTDGSISITTGCVFASDDLTITWSKVVNGNTVALSSDDPSPVTSADKSTCTRTCHTEEDKKVTSGFTHTEYTGTDSETFQYMVTVSHSSYPDNADIYTWTSANYTQKKATKPPDDCTWWKLKCWPCWWKVIFGILLYIVVSILIGIILGCFLIKTTCHCDCFYEGESCKDCANNYYCKCKCCDKTPCGALCNIKGLPYWYQVLWATILGSAVAFGIWLVWRCCNNGNNDTSKNAVGTGSNPKNAGKKLLDQKKPSKSPGKDDDVKKENPASEKQNQHADQAHKVEIEGKKAGRPQPPPPVGANQSSQLPNIHTEGHDSKDSDDYHPLAGVGTPTEKAGTLPTITDTPRKTKKRTKKKKKDKQEDNQTTETAIDF